jgi:hypothetical protein
MFAHEEIPTFLAVALTGFMGVAAAVLVILAVVLWRVR